MQNNNFFRYPPIYKSKNTNESSKQEIRAVDFNFNRHKTLNILFFDTNESSFNKKVNTRLNLT